MNAPTKPTDGLEGIALPSWADSLTGRLILSNIVASPPEYRRFDDSSDYAFYGKVFRGRDVAKLRHLFDDVSNEIIARERAAYEAGEPHRHLTDELQAHLMAERPDALVERLIGGRNNG